MRVLLSIIVAVSLGAWTVSSVAQERKAGDSFQGVNYQSGEGGSQGAVLDAIYPEEGRVVINDREYFLDGSIIINNQVVSAGSAMAILREGQRLLNIFGEREDDGGRLVLRGVETL